MAGTRLLFFSAVSHNVVALRAALRAAGATVDDGGLGLLEVVTSDAAMLLTTVRASFSATEAQEIRAAVLGDEEGRAMLAAAFGAPTLAQLDSRVEHSELHGLFADEQTAFYSVYQPIVDLRDAVPGDAVPGDAAPHDVARVIGHEALLRARGSRGVVMPDAMFAAAAAAGWLNILDRIGRTCALHGAAGWLGDDLLFVNFLPTAIYRPEVCLRTTERAATTAGIRLGQVVFEVTETERVTNLDHLSDVFGYYRERGCLVAIDDLGAGYSSLDLLVRLQPDVVKLDKEIVQRLPDPVSEAVVAAVVGITHAYGGRVLAECVETADQVDAARQLGVDLAQGWFFGRPQERTAGTSSSRLGTHIVAGAHGSDLAQEVMLTEQTVASGSA